MTKYLASKTKILTITALALFSIIATFDIHRAVAASDPLVSFFINITGETNPESTIVATAGSYGFDVDSSYLVWMVNGKELKSGAGEKMAAIKLGPAGTPTTIEVTATTLTGATYSKVKVITPAAVDLLWEAYTYKPKWYKGKALPSSSSRVRLVAVPDFKKSNGEMIPASELVYNWTLNYKSLSSFSGYGKNTLLFKMPLLGNESTIGVEVSTKSGLITGRGEATLTADEIKTIIYKNHPTMGTEFNKPLGEEAVMEGDELGIKVEPLFFALKDFGDIIYGWTINETAIENSAKINHRVFTREPGQKGYSSVSIEIKNPNDFLQSSTNNLLINFNE